MPGEVVGEIAFLRQDPNAVYSATVQAREGSLIASASFSILRGESGLESVRVKLVERFGQIAAERLEATSALTVDAMSTGLWRERRLALHLSTIIAVLALFVVLSNSLDMIRKLALTRMSEATFVTVFYYAFDTVFGVMFFWLIRTLQEPPRVLGLHLDRWPRQVAAGLVWSLRPGRRRGDPRLASSGRTGSLGLRLDRRISPHPRWRGADGPDGRLCPVPVPGSGNTSVRAGVQAPIMNAFGARLAGVGAVVSTLVAATMFGALHIVFGVAVVVLAAFVGLYWVFAFVRTRSVLAVAVSHMVVGVAAFYWFGLIR